MNSIIYDQSIKTRFLATLFANIGGMGLSFLAGIIIARGLGPAGYGNFNFLLGSFASIILLLDMGTASAFYTFLSQRKRGKRFYLYYFLWIGIEFLVAFLLISFILPDSWKDRIWLGQKREVIVLAFLASFMMAKVWQTATQVGESIRATVIVQLHNIILAGLHLCIVLAMVSVHRLTITNLFLLIIFEYPLFALILAARLRHNLIESEEETHLSNVINEFKAYCAPLVLYTIVGFAYSFADTWLLQRFGGAVQQGFYSISLKFTTICLIATTSMLNIFWKEIAEASERHNQERLYQLYKSTSRALCFVSALGACFLIPFSKEIIYLLLGPRYEASWPCLAIMFLYPIHQSLGQINASYFYATAQTKLYSNLSIIMMMTTIPITYFVLASPSATVPGLGLGSVGLALKVVVLQIIWVNIFSYFISKLSRWRFDFLYQFATTIPLLLVSFTVKQFLIYSSHLLNIPLHPLSLILCSLPLYILVTALIIYLFLGLSGMGKDMISSFINLLKVEYH